MRRRGYTLIEIGFVVVVVGIIIAVSLPDSDTKAKQEAATAAAMFESDVNYARGKSIADPTDPLVIKLDAANKKYWLAKKSSPDTPINHPQTGKPFETKYGKGGKKGLENVDIVGNDFGGDGVLGFDSVGNIDQATSAVLQLSSKGASVEVIVKPAAARTTTSTTLTKTLTVEGGKVLESVKDPAVTEEPSVIIN
ncbi:MAG: hypothetical protein HZA51_16520 [Planctomycetes bacterium]|nr:hypothetical protein [Planctomycetota bacterium]